MGFLKGAWNKFVGAIEGAINFLRPLADFIGIELPDDLGSWKIAQEEATAAVEAAEPAVVELETAAVVLASTVTVPEAVPAMEAFDLSTVNLKTQLQQVKPEIKDIGGLLEASGMQAGAAVLPWGFFADEVSVKVPNAMDIVMDSIMEVPPTAEQVAADLRAVAPTWGQSLIDGLNVHLQPGRTSAPRSQRAFEGGAASWARSSRSARRAGVYCLREDRGWDGGREDSANHGGLRRDLPIGGPLQALLAIIAGSWGSARRYGASIKGMFGGPSEATVAARESMEAYASTIEADTVNQERLRDWISRRVHLRAMPVIVTHFQDLPSPPVRRPGWRRPVACKYQQAVEDGNRAGIDAVMAPDRGVAGSRFR